MTVRLFVGNLAFEVTEAELQELFSPCAPSHVRMPTDRETGRPRGFAFVEFSDGAKADEAVRRFNQQVFKGRPLVVNEARPREDGGGVRPRAPSFRSSSPRPPSDGPPPAEDPTPSGQPRRAFGPEAHARDRRRREGSVAKGERAPKGPLRERSGGQIFFGAAADDDAPEDDSGLDNFALWARDDGKTRDSD